MASHIVTSLGMRWMQDRESTLKNRLSSLNSRRLKKFWTWMDLHRDSRWWTWCECQHDMRPDARYRLKRWRWMKGMYLHHWTVFGGLRWLETKWHSSWSSDEGDMMLDVPRNSESWIHDEWRRPHFNESIILWYTVETAVCMSWSLHYERWIDVPSCVWIPFTCDDKVISWLHEAIWRVFTHSSKEKLRIVRKSF